MENKSNLVSPMSPLEEIAEIMYNKQLRYIENIEVVYVVYSKDKSKRFVVTKNSKGFYKFEYQEICLFDEQEWLYICNYEDALPAYWSSVDDLNSYSFYGSEDDVMKALWQDVKYRQYFE